MKDVCFTPARMMGAQFSGQTALRATFCRNEVEATIIFEKRSDVVKASYPDGTEVIAGYAAMEYWSVLIDGKEVARAAGERVAKNLAESAAFEKDRGEPLNRQYIVEQREIDADQAIIAGQDAQKDQILAEFAEWVGNEQAMIDADRQRRADQNPVPGC